MGAPTQPDFDRFSDSYDHEMEKAIGFCAQSHDFYTQAKADSLVRLARQRVGDPATLDVLDVGCGTGLTASFLLKSFKSVTGVDVSEKAVVKAREHVPGGLFHAFDGRKIPAPDNAFDVVVAINVFHHVGLQDRLPLVVEMRRVVKPTGGLVVFEHNPWNPLTLRAVRQCAFDGDAILLTSARSRRLLREAGLVHVSSRYLLFLPFGQRISAWADQCLGWLPLGAQHYTVGAKQGLGA